MPAVGSACLLFHLKLPNMLRCQRIPPQTFQQAAASFRTAQSIGDRLFAWRFLSRSDRVQDRYALPSWPRSARVPVRPAFGRSSLHCRDYQ
jgi:hypothetical protein